MRIRKYYYWCDSGSSYQHYEEATYAENVNQAISLFRDSYFKRYGNYPFEVLTRRVNKATAEDINRESDFE